MYYIYDNKNFYQSIFLKGLLEALHFAKGFVNITPHETEIILHCHRSIVFQNGEIWIKNSQNDGFDVTQVFFDVSGRIGLHIL